MAPPVLGGAGLRRLGPFPCPCCRRLPPSQNCAGPTPPRRPHLPRPRFRISGFQNLDFRTSGLQDSNHADSSPGSFHSPSASHASGLSSGGPRAAPRGGISASYPIDLRIFSTTSGWSCPISAMNLIRPPHFGQDSTSTLNVRFIISAHV